MRGEQVLRLTIAVAVVAFGLLFTPQICKSDDMTGVRTETIGAVVTGVSLQYKNKTGREICDFTFKLGDECNVNIVSITVTKTSGGSLGDWDVDDNVDGDNTDPLENDDTDGTPGRTARTAVKDPHDGAEAAPQNTDGNCVARNQEFEIVIQFSGVTTDACELIVTPTNGQGLQLCSLEKGFQPGGNRCALANAGTVTPGMGMGQRNNTAQVVASIELVADGDFLVDQVFDVDPETSEIRAQSSCGPSSSCILQLANPAPPGDIISFDATFNQMGSGDSTIVTVTAIGPPEVPSLTVYGLSALVVLLLGTAVWIIRKRRSFAEI